MAAKNYTLEQRLILNEKLQPYLKPYYENDGKKLNEVVCKLLIKLKYHDVVESDFVSLANEIITNSMYDYDFKQEFDGYVYKCLENKFKTEMTRRCRKKREGDRTALSLEEKVGNDDEKSTIGEMIAGKSNIENDYFDKKEEGYSNKMQNYLSRLSPLQKEVLKLISIGFEPNEILCELQINKKIYEECYKAIHSYRNIEILL